ncbi:MAG: hypothetical protein ACM3SM_10775, partial [Bacteroidota bacterium]
MKNKSGSVFWWLVMPVFICLSIPGTLQPQTNNINSIGSFESDMPSYWKKGSEPGGSTLSWATDQKRSMSRSLKITKSQTGEAAVWESENQLDLWSPQHLKDVDIFIGAYVRTQGVNTNPQND